MKPPATDSVRSRAAGTSRSSRPAPARPSSVTIERPVPSAPKGSLLPFVGVAGLFVLVVVTLHLSSTLRKTLQGELAGRLRISADLASDLFSDPDRTFDVNDPETLARIEEIRRATSVSEIVLYDAKGDLVGGATSKAQLGMGVPRAVRIGAAHSDRSADPHLRSPEHDMTGGLTLLVPLSKAAGGGALLTRIDPDAQGDLPAIDFLFQAAKALAGIITAAGFLILLRWVARGGESSAPRATSAIPSSDVGMVLGTVKEVMTTLKDNETTYRDRWTAAEADAETERRRSDIILESIESGIVAFDGVGRITMFNLGAERIFGIAARNAMGRTVSEVFGEGDPVRHFANEVLKEVRAPARAEWERRQPDGESLWLGASCSVIRDGRGFPQGGILLIDDVTETKNLRDAAGLRDRLSAVGEMSAGIAHEIKNSLHALMGHANLLREDHEGEEPPLAVRGILSEVRSLEAMVKGILEFSKPTRLVRATEDVNAVLCDSVESLRERASSVGVTIELELDKDLPCIPVESTSMRRVFLNCILNAVEAMEDGGTLTVSTRVADFRSEDDSQGNGAGKRPAVRVAFRDTGPGIPEADRQKIFTPFYSTKREGHGLGLALVHRTITDHGGRLHLHSRQAVGTEFVILLPMDTLA